MFKNITNRPCIPDCTNIAMNSDTKTLLSPF